MSRVLTFLIMIVVSMPLGVSAHSNSASLTAEENGMVIDVGYDPMPQVGRRVTLDFSLREGHEEGAPVSFDSVWLRLSNGTLTFFAGPIARSQIGPTTLVLVLPDVAEGTMSLSVRFERDASTLIEKTFTLPVAPAPQNEEASPSLLYGLLGVLALACVILIARDIHRSRVA